MKNIKKITFLALAGIILSGCSHQSKKSETHSSSTSTGKGLVVVNKHHTNKAEHLSSNDLSPQKTVSVVVAYAGIKFPAQWGRALNDAQKDKLTVDLKNQSNYPYMQDGSGVAYMVTPSLGYTLQEVDGDNKIYLYADKKKIAQATMSQMVDYLNHNDGESIVNKLAPQANVNDERNNDSTPGDKSTISKTKLPGDAGLVNVPQNLQGTWYGYNEGSNKLDKVTFSEHDFIASGQDLELHKIDSDFFNSHDYSDMSDSYHKATKNWGMATIVDKPLHGIRWLNIRSWMQGAGDGGYYGAHTEDGQPVMVTAYGATCATGSVYWKTPALAKQYKDKKFDDLYYED